MDNDKVFQFKEVTIAKAIKPKKLSANERSKLRRAIQAFLESDKAPVVAGFPDNISVRKRVQDFYPSYSGAGASLTLNTARAWAEYNAHFNHPDAPHISVHYSATCELKFEFEFTEDIINLVLVEQNWEEEEDEEEDEEDEDEDDDDDEIPTKSKSKTAKEDIDD